MKGKERKLWREDEREKKREREGISRHERRNKRRAREGGKRMRNERLKD